MYQLESRHMTPPTGQPQQATFESHLLVAIDDDGKNASFEFAIRIILNYVFYIAMAKTKRVTQVKPIAKDRRTLIHS